MRKRFDKSMVVVVGVKYPKGNYHAVRLRGFDSDSPGRLTANRIFDPAPGNERSFSPAEFSRYFNDWAQSKVLGKSVAIAIQGKYAGAACAQQPGPKGRPVNRSRIMGPALYQIRQMRYLFHSGTLFGMFDECSLGWLPGPKQCHRRNHEFSDNHNDDNAPAA